jgi:hypothetical protein
MKMANTIFKLFHAYGGKVIHFVLDNTSVVAGDLAVYMQFKAEIECDDYSICLDNDVVFDFLKRFGAKEVELPVQEEIENIDMYTDRERRCGEWYNSNYAVFEQNYSEQAQATLNSFSGRLNRE